MAICPTVTLKHNINLPWLTLFYWHKTLIYQGWHSFTMPSCSLSHNAMPFIQMYVHWIGMTEVDWFPVKFKILLFRKNTQTLKPLFEWSKKMNTVPTFINSYTPYSKLDQKLLNNDLNVYYGNYVTATFWFTRTVLYYMLWCNYIIIYVIYPDQIPHHKQNKC